MQNRCIYAILKNTLHPNRSFRLVWKHKSVNNFNLNHLRLLCFDFPYVCGSINLVSSYCRTALLFSILLTAGAGFISALSPNYISLLALRFLVGIGVGGTHVFSSWFLEFVPAKNRGAWMIVFSAFWTFGTIFEASLAWVWIMIPSLPLLHLTVFRKYLLFLSKINLNYKYDFICPINIQFPIVNSSAAAATLRCPETVAPNSSSTAATRGKPT